MDEGGMMGGNVQGWIDGAPERDGETRHVRAHGLVGRGVCGPLTVSVAHKSKRGLRTSEVWQYDDITHHAPYTTGQPHPPVEVVPELPADRWEWCSSPHGWYADCAAGGRAFLRVTDTRVVPLGRTPMGSSVAHEELAAVVDAVRQRNGLQVDEPIFPTTQYAPEDATTPGDEGDLGDGAVRFVPVEEGWYVVAFGSEQRLVFMTSDRVAWADDSANVDLGDAEDLDGEWLHPKPLDLAAIVKQAAEVDPIAQVERFGCAFFHDDAGPVLLDPWGGKLAWCAEGVNVYSDTAADLHKRAFAAKLAKLDEKGAGDVGA